jgi:hypothetical protein
MGLNCMKSYIIKNELILDIVWFRHCQRGDEIHHDSTLLPGPYGQ